MLFFNVTENGFSIHKKVWVGVGAALGGALLVLFMVALCTQKKTYAQEKIRRRLDGCISSNSFEDDSRTPIVLRRSSC